MREKTKVTIFLTHLFVRLRGENVEKFVFSSLKSYFLSGEVIGRIPWNYRDIQTKYGTPSFPRFHACSIRRLRISMVFVPE